MTVFDPEFVFFFNILLVLKNSQYITDGSNKLHQMKEKKES